MDFARRALHLRQPVDGFRQALSQRVHVPARLADEARHAAVLLAKQREQQVLRFDLLVVAAEREALGLGNAALQLGRELVEAHGSGSCEPGPGADGAILNRFKGV